MRKKRHNILLEKIKEYEDALDCHGRWPVGKIRDYEKKWQFLNQKYAKIRIYGIQFVSIGETIPRLFMYLRDHDKRDKHTLCVVLPTFFPGYYIGGLVNRKIFDIYAKNLYFITEKNIGFWKYAAVFHSHQVSMEQFDAYQYRDISYTFHIKLGQPLLPLNKEIKRYAEGKMRSMGIRGEYICIHAREAATKIKNFISAYDDTSIIDADINSYGQACMYMREQGCQAVRLGKDESRECRIEGVIDYANQFYDDLMDFYLVENCRFIIGGMAGIVAVASFWGRPVLQVNTLSFCYGQESLSRTDYDLYIPKKLYSTRKRRFLNLYESWDMSFKCDRYTKRFEEEGIQVIDNTEKEILDATVEMNEKINHTWVQTPEEKECMAKYRQIIDLWKSRHKLTYISKKDGGQGRDLLPRAICYSYLKENMYLLETGEFYGES